MKRFEKAEMEIIEFEAEDIITTSICNLDNGGTHGSDDYQGNISDNSEDGFEAG